MNDLIRARWGRGSLLALALTAVALAAPSPRAHGDDLKHGRNALQAGRLDQALAAFEKAASQGSAEGRAGVGQVWLKRRDYPRALEAFRQAQKMDPNLALGYFGQAEVLRLQNQCAEAVPLYRKATELDRKFPEAQLGLGRCLGELRRHAEAVSALNEGLKWGPRWRPRFLVALGNAEMARDSLRDAGIYFTKAREEAPDEPEPHKALGNFYLRRGIPSLAVPEFQAALGMDSTDVESHYLLGQALYFDRRYGQALDQYRWVVERDPEFAPGQLALGNLYYLSGPADPKRYADARPPLEKYVQLEPREARGWSLLGRTAFFLGDKEAAVAALRQADSLGETSKEHFNILGRALSEQRQWQAALAAYAKGDPDIGDQLRIGQMLVILDRHGAADSLYSGIIARDSTSRDARFALNEMGKLKFRLKDYPDAIRFFRRRIALDPASGEAYYYIGLSYKEMKQYPEALAALQQASEIDSGRADRLFWLGILHAQLEHKEQARAAFEGSLAQDSTSATAAIAYRQLGFYALLDRDYPKATQLLERAAALNDRDIQTWVWLAQGYQNAGNRRKALDGYDRALQLDPRQPEALKGKKILEGGGR